jgi:hypothetical protein
VVDAERYIDFTFMVQCRKDDPGRQRAVTRIDN